MFVWADSRHVFTERTTRERPPTRKPLAGRGPRTLRVAAAELPTMLGITSAPVVGHPRALALRDTTIA